MEILKKKIACNWGDDITIFFLGDVHEGSANHAEKEFNESVDIIKQELDKNPHAYWIGIGDYVDAINHRDPRFNPLELARKYEFKDLANLCAKQTEYFYDKIKSISHRCLALLYGNHEESYVRHNAFDPVQLLQYLIMKDSNEECSPFILGYTGIITLSIDVKGHRFKYDIALSHGAGGGGFREGYGINKVHDVFRWYDADCYVMGHIHRMMTDTQQRIYTQNEELKRKRILYGTNGCYMFKSSIGTRGYFEGKPSPESSIGFLRLDIKPNKLRDRFDTKLTKIEF